MAGLYAPQTPYSKTNDVFGNASDPLIVDRYGTEDPMAGRSVIGIDPFTGTEASMTAVRGPSIGSGGIGAEIDPPRGSGFADFVSSNKGAAAMQGAGDLLGAATYAIGGLGGSRKDAKAAAAAQAKIDEQDRLNKLEEDRQKRLTAEIASNQLAFRESQLDFYERMKLAENALDDEFDEYEEMTKSIDTMRSNTMDNEALGKIITSFGISGREGE